MMMIVIYDPSGPIVEVDTANREVCKHVGNIIPLRTLMDMIEKEVVYKYSKISEIEIDSSFYRMLLKCKLFSIIAPSYSYKNIRRGIAIIDENNIKVEKTLRGEKIVTRRFIVTYDDDHIEVTSINATVHDYDDKPSRILGVDGLLIPCWEYRNAITYEIDVEDREKLFEIARKICKLHGLEIKKFSKYSNMIILRHYPTIVLYEAHGKTFLIILRRYLRKVEKILTIVRRYV